MKKVIAGAALATLLFGSVTPALANTATETQTTTVQTTSTTDPAATTSPTNTTTTDATTTTTDATTTTTDATTTTTEAIDAELPEVTMTPDQLFYFLKIWVEEIQVALTRDSAERAILLEEQAQTRLAEAVKMAEAGKHDLAEKALTEAQVKLTEASKQIDAAVEGGKDLQELVKQVEADQLRFAKAVSSILEKLPEEVKTELEPLTADLLVQVAGVEDAATQNDAVTEEAEQVAEEAGLKDKLANLEPRQVLVLKAMADASGKDLAEVYAMYEQNPGLGRIAKELGLKMGSVQHAAQIEWKKAKAGLEIEVEVEEEEAEEESAAVTTESDESDSDTDSDTETKKGKGSKGKVQKDRDQDDEDEDEDEEEDDSKLAGKQKENPGKGAEKSSKARESEKNRGNANR